MLSRRTDDDEACDHTSRKGLFQTLALSHLSFSRRARSLSLFLVALVLFWATEFHNNSAGLIFAVPEKRNHGATITPSRRVVALLCETCMCLYLCYYISWIFVSYVVRCGNYAARNNCCAPVFGIKFCSKRCGSTTTPITSMCMYIVHYVYINAPRRHRHTFCSTSIYTLQRPLPLPLALCLLSRTMMSHTFIEVVL